MFIDIEQFKYDFERIELDQLLDKYKLTFAGYRKIKIELNLPRKRRKREFIIKNGFIIHPNAYCPH